MKITSTKLPVGLDPNPQTQDPERRGPRNPPPGAPDQFRPGRRPQDPGDVCLGYRATASIVSAEAGRDEVEGRGRDRHREVSGVFVTLAIDGKITEPIFIAEGASLNLVKTDPCAGQVRVECQADFSRIGLGIWGGNGEDRISLGSGVTFGQLLINPMGGSDQIAISAGANGQQATLVTDGQDEIDIASGGSFRTTIMPNRDPFAVAPAPTPVVSSRQRAIAQINRDIEMLKSEMIEKGLELKGRGGNFFNRIERNGFENAMTKLLLVCDQWCDCTDKETMYSDTIEGSPYAERYGTGVKSVLNRIDRARVSREDARDLVLKIKDALICGRTAVKTGKRP